MIESSRLQGTHPKAPSTPRRESLPKPMQISPYEDSDTPRLGTRNQNCDGNYSFFGREMEVSRGLTPLLEINLALARR